MDFFRVEGLASMNEDAGAIEAPRQKSPKKWLRMVLIAFVVLGCVKLASLAANQFSASASESLADAKARKDASAGVGHAKAAAEVVEAYYKKHGDYPTSLTAAEFDVSLPKPVQSIRLNSATGVLQVVLMGQGSFSNRTFLYEPNLGSSGVFRWRCNPGEVLPNRLPDECPRVAKAAE